MSNRIRMRLFLLFLASLFISSCATTNKSFQGSEARVDTRSIDYTSRVPSTYATNEKVIVVDPRVHAFAAYDSSGNLIRAGAATAGGDWCPDIGRSCHTRSGHFRIASLGGPECKSSIYPLPRGGAPMPYCMFFNGNQGLHGSYDVVDGNVSHGCVRMHVEDAQWVRYEFAGIGTKVIVKPYS